MKKLLLLIFFPLLLLSIGCAANDDDDDDDISVIIIDDVLGDLPDSRSATARKTVVATLDYNKQMVEFTFNDDIGSISIIIKNEMGETVGQDSCNTKFEPAKYVSVPITPGGYTISILGENYEGDGYYNIMGTF